MSFRWFLTQKIDNNHSEKRRKTNELKIQILDGFELILSQNLKSVEIGVRAEQAYASSITELMELELQIAF